MSIFYLWVAVIVDGAGACALEIRPHDHAKVLPVPASEGIQIANLTEYIGNQSLFGVVLKGSLLSCCVERCTFIAHVERLSRKNGPLLDWFGGRSVGNVLKLRGIVSRFVFVLNESRDIYGWSFAGVKYQSLIAGRGFVVHHKRPIANLQPRPLLQMEIINGGLKGFTAGNLLRSVAALRLYQRVAGHADRIACSAL